MQTGQCSIDFEKMQEVLGAVDRVCATFAAQMAKAIVEMEAFMEAIKSATSPKGAPKRLAPFIGRTECASYPFWS